MQRYLIESHGPNKANAAFMFQEAFRICQRERMSRITLAVSNKTTFPSTPIGELLGDGARKICQGMTLHLQENLSLDLVCVNKGENFYAYEMVVAVYLSLDDLYKLDSDMSAKAIVFLPWLEDEGKQWLATRRPTILGVNTWQVLPTAFPQDVDNALSTLTQGINLSTGLAHPSDRNTVRNILKKVKDLGYVLSPNDAKNWAVQKGWPYVAVKELAAEVAKVFQQ